MIKTRRGMRRAGNSLLPAIACALALLRQGAFARADTTLTNNPRVFLLEGKHLAATRHHMWSGDKSFAPALTALERETQEALKAGPFSVMEKNALPPSGDKQDFMSQAPYFWPDPKSPDGRPYVRRDGERNPEIYKLSDRRNLGRMNSAVETLSLAYYFTTNEAYAEKSAKLLRTWFLDPA